MAETNPPSLNLLRRVGRKGFRAIRPFLLPLLTRVQSRLQLAIEQSPIPGSLAALERGQSEVMAAIAQLQIASASLQVGLDALRLDQQEVTEKLMPAIEELSIAQSHVMSRADLLVRRGALSLGSEALLWTPDGFLLTPSEDRTLLAAVWESGGQLEPGTIKVMKALLREGDQYVDVGAHIGLTVLPAARKVGPTGLVVAFEPGARTAALLRQSVALNFVAQRVVLHQCAAGDEAGTARLHLSSTLGESSLLDLPGSPVGEEVDVRTVDSMVASGRPIRLVKIDAEGYEPQVWRGMQRVIFDNPALAVLIEFGPSHLKRAGVSIVDWFAMLTAPGFTAYEVDEMTGVLRSLRDLPALGVVSSLNLLLLRRPLTDYPELRLE